MALDFLCIGAPKAGTTWLQSALQSHPDIWIPPVKELHYFDRKFAISRVAETRAPKMGLAGFYNQQPQKRIIRTYARSIQRFSVNDVIWTHRFLANEPTDDWYQSLFENRKNKLCGEMTTDYCALSNDAIKHIHSLFPEVKIIFLLRDPIARAWSHARMLLPVQLGKPLQEISEAEFATYLSHPAAKQKGQYSLTLRRWQQYFSSDHLFIGFFEDISASPRILIKNVFEFLGVSVDVSRPFQDMKKKVNVGRGRSKIPPNLESRLAREYLDELHRLNDMFDGYPAHWLKNAQRVLGDNDS